MNARRSQPGQEDISEAIDAGAFAIWRTFVRVTPTQYMPALKRHETPEEAMHRRWRNLPHLTRTSFRDEAKACLSAVGVI